MGKARRFAAVDFDSRRLRVALAEPSASGTRISNLTSVAIPEGMDVGDPQAMGRMLGQTLRDVGFRGAGVVMSVPRSEAVLKPLTLPPGTHPEELAEMVHYQVARELPFPPQDAVVDFTTERHYDAARDERDRTESDDEPGAEEVSILVAAIRLSVVDYYRQVAEASGVKLLRLGLRPYANMRCVEACDPRTDRQRLAVVNITADETEIDVLCRGSLEFSRSIVKIVSATDAPDATDAVTALVTEIARTLRSYEAVSRRERIDAVLVAGGTGAEDRAAKLLAGRLGVPCQILQPANAFTERIEGPVHPEFISALGQALAHPAADEMPFDFLNPKRPPVRRDPRKTRAMVVAIAAVVLLLGAVASGWAYRRGKQNAYNSLRGKQKDLEELIEKAKPLADRVEAVEAWAAADRAWMDHWAYLSCLFPSARDVYVTSLKTNSDGSITITVQARSNDAITELGRRLNEAGYEFTPGQIKTGNDPHEYLYNTTVRVFAREEMKIDLSTTQPVARPKDDSSREQFYKKSSSGGRGRARRRDRGRRRGR